MSRRDHGRVTTPRGTMCSICITQVSVGTGKVTGMCFMVLLGMGPGVRNLAPDLQGFSVMSAENFGQTYLTAWAVLWGGLCLGLFNVSFEYLKLESFSKNCICFIKMC